MNLQKQNWQNILAFLVIIGAVCGFIYSQHENTVLTNNNLRAIQGTLQADTQNLEILEKRTAKIEDMLIDRIHKNTIDINVLKERTKYVKPNSAI
jgi:hypothetical protein